MVPTDGRRSPSGRRAWLPGGARHCGPADAPPLAPTRRLASGRPGSPANRGEAEGRRGSRPRRENSRSPSGAPCAFGTLPMERPVAGRVTRRIQEPDSGARSSRRREPRGVNVCAPVATCLRGRAARGHWSTRTNAPPGSAPAPDVGPPTARVSPRSHADAGRPAGFPFEPASGRGQRRVLRLGVAGQVGPGPRRVRRDHRGPPPAGGRPLRVPRLGVSRRGHAAKRRAGSAGVSKAAAGRGPRSPSSAPAADGRGRRGVPRRHPSRQRADPPAPSRGGRARAAVCRRSGRHPGVQGTRAGARPRGAAGAGSSTGASRISLIA